jgi:4-hydroxy-3-methylbut-2-enyl diphosphate reductase
MIITIDKTAGFCPGVRKAIRTAEKQLEENKGFHSLGSILHNEEEMGRLGELGLVVIDKDDVPGLCGQKLLFRAHGEPPETFELAAKHDVQVVDATCAVVRKLQKDVAHNVREMQKQDGQVVLYGKPGHPEVLGLLGQTSGSGILVCSLQDLGKVDMRKPVRLFSQTTMDANSYDLIASAIREQMARHSAEPDLVVHKSICSHVLKRVPSLKDFASKHELVIFVSGRESSNGKKLFNICSAINPNTHFISEPGELKAEWFKDTGSVGISGAASTPLWLMENVAKKIKELN